MSSEQAPLEACFLSSITQITAAQWNQISGTDYPFIRHEFLLALEQSGSTNAESGWQPCHLTVLRDDQLVALMPLYLKSHSYGEYVFDWSWADAWQQQGLDYYPKLVTAIPFTPATGPRMCVAAQESRPELLAAMLAAVEQYAAQQQLSSWHLLFPEQADAQELAGRGTSMRLASQFHWFNRGYAQFDDFLAGLNSRKRKSLRRERRRVSEQGITLQRRQGSDISDADWERFYRFYQITYAKRSGHGGYLKRDFFQQIGRTLPEHCVMIMAYLDGEAVAGSLCFRSSDTLYGRYWGCDRELDCLHFEACYYQGIEYCIEQGLQRFDPGAQGEHKIQRGFEPVPTWSNHWISDPRFAAAIADFTRREAPHIEAYISQASAYLPFKQPR
jgi:predicted N-acyltransferase